MASSTRALRRAPWPTLAPLELSASVPWLLLQRAAHDDHINSHVHSDVHSQQREAEEEEEEADASASPYAAKRTSLEKRAPLSPAQRAAKRILKLREEMELLQPQNDEEVTTRPHPLPRPHPRADQHPHTRPHPQPRTSGKCPRRRVTSEKQQEGRLRLQRWLDETAGDERSAADEEQEISFSSEMRTRVHDAMHATLGSGLWRDVVASRIAAEMTSETVFGGAVATRRPECPIEPAPQWMKSTASSASTATSTATSTSTAMSTSTSTSTSTDLSEPTEMDGSASIQATAEVIAMATEIREDAAHCVAVGRVADAIQTLQRGIHTLLHDATTVIHVEDAVRMFDYSATAHALAIRIQRRYRARHRARVLSAATIQRSWRRVWCRRRVERQRAQRTASALRVQRFYRHARLDRSARVVQRCLRLFRQFKAFFRLRYAVLLVLQRERLRKAAVARRHQIRRRVKRKLWTLLVFNAIVRRRRLATTRLQATWRGWRARRTYAVTLHAVARQESARRHGEDAFVDARLAAATQWITAFVHETSVGHALVRWRVAAPWIRWRRLRRRWNDVDRSRRVAAMCALFSQDESVWTTTTWTWFAVVAVLLSGTSNAKAVVGLARRQKATERVALSADDVTRRLVQLETALAAENAREKTRVSGRWRQLWTRLRTMATDGVDHVVYVVLLVLWTCWWCPWLYASTCVWTRSARCQRSRRRAAATIVHDQRRQLQSFLRHLFRRLEGTNGPRFVCDWCGDATALALEALAHRQRCDVHRSALSTEWNERERDVVDVRRRQWSVRPHKNHAVLVISESLERRRFTRVQTLNRVPAQHRSALELLINAALCCGPETPSASTLLATELLALLTPASMTTANVASVHPLLQDLELQVLPIWTVDAPPAPGWQSRPAAGELVLAATDSSRVRRWRDSWVDRVRHVAVRVARWRRRPASPYVVPDG